MSTQFNTPVKTTRPLSPVCPGAPKRTNIHNAPHFPLLDTIIGSPPNIVMNTEVYPNAPPRPTFRPIVNVEPIQFNF